MIWRCASLLLALLSLSACGFGTRLAYENLDTLVRLQVDNYVALNPAQLALLNREFNSVWAWHRREELPDYALSLRRAADRVEQGPLDRPAIDAIASSIRTAVERTAQRALPGLANLLTSLDDAQVSELLAAQQDELDEELASFRDETTAQSLRRLTNQLEDRIENWIGPLTPTQRALLASRMAEAEARDEFADSRLQAKADQDQQAFAALLATRQQAGFTLRLQALAYPQDAAAEAERSLRRERSRSFYTALGGSLTPKQRAHFAKRLRRYADEASTLATKATAPAP